MSLIGLIACKDYYNDTIDWIDNLQVGANIQTIKNNQPDFIKIAWDKPDTLNNEFRYAITEIKGNRDILNMQHFLVFSDDKYVGRSFHK